MPVAGLSFGVMGRSVSRQRPVNSMPGINRWFAGTEK
jgi:hypothetical protein